MKKITYKDSGVDIQKGEKALADVKSLIKTTFNNNVLSSIGGFGGLFEVPEGYLSPVLVSSTDGVGTKLKVAVMAGRHDTVGEDLVNHCVNDIAVIGARPLYFLDYFGTAHLDEHIFHDVIKGFVRGCKNNAVALLGGETAEMPGIYHDNDYDLCGTIVGIVEKKDIINGQHIQKGDLLIGLASNGLHTNGYSLARKVLFNKFTIDQYVEELSSTIAEELLRVHKCYFYTIQSVISSFTVKGIAHITGGGIIGNTSRVLPAGLGLNINWDVWQEQPIFGIIQKTGSVPEEDMRRTFNLGIGLVFIVPEHTADKALEYIKNLGNEAWLIGEVTLVKN